MRKIFLLSLAVAALMECGLSAIPNVGHNKVKPEPRVVGVDQAHWWVKINRMSREGKPAQEIFDFINERSKQEQGKLLSNQKRLAADIFRGMVGVIENKFKSIGEVAPAQAFVPAPSHEKVTAYLYTRHLSTHPSQGAVRPVKGSTAMLVTMEKGALADLATSQLVPGNVYTLRWIVINRPKACATSPCTPPDVLERTTATNADVTYGGGIIAGKNGEGRFNSFLAVGKMPNSWFGNGYRNPLGAEIHFAINDHGPLVPDLAHSMLNSYRGGCTDESLPPPFPASAKADGTPGPNACRLVQTVAFIQKE